MLKNNKSILVTGGAGFIGSHLVDFLINRNYKVIVLDNFSYGKRKWVNKNAKIFKGDIIRLTDCIKACKNVHAVIHLAAMSRAGPSENAMQICIKNNVIGTQNILEAASKAKVKKLIYAGSATYYGNINKAAKEDFKSDFLSPYSLSKYLGEQLCLFYSKKKHLSCNILRFFNVYGPRQPTKGQYALVIGIFLNQIRRNLPITIFGNGNQKRDFIYIDDLIEAIYLVLNSKVKNQIFNIGYGKSTRILTLAKKLSKNIKFLKKRKNDAFFSQADISKISRFFNWKPNVSLDLGLKKLIK